MKKLIILICSILVIFGISFLTSKRKAETVVGVIVPMEHQALNDIVSGLREGLKSDKPITLRVMNAQGDPNIQRSIIQQLVQDDCDVLVPIGTGASQMTLALAKNK